MIDWRRKAERFLPTGLDTITPEWLTLALRSRDKAVPEICAARVERIGEGFGLTGAVGRARIEWKREVRHLPTSVIVKLPLAQTSVTSLYRKHSEQGAPRNDPYFQRCAREVRFYNELAPLGLTPAPMCYFAAASEDERAIVLLLEDIEDGRQGDVLKGCSVEEVIATVEAIAPFHGRWWHEATGSDGHLSWLPRWVGDPARRHERFRSQVEPFLERWDSTINPEIVELIRLMETRYAAVLRAIDDLPLSAIHADLHLDNLLFVGTGEWTVALVLDWQSVCVGPIAVDLSTLITGSLSPEDMRLGFDLLLQRYSVSLLAHAGIDYPVEQLRQDMRLALLWRLGGTVGWLSNADVDQMAGRERELVKAAFGDGRLTSALIELDARSLLVEF